MGKLLQHKCGLAVLLACLECQRELNLVAKDWCNQNIIWYMVKYLTSTCNTYVLYKHQWIIQLSDSKSWAPQLSGLPSISPVRPFIHLQRQKPTGHLPSQRQVPYIKYPQFLSGIVFWGDGYHPIFPLQIYLEGDGFPNQISGLRFGTNMSWKVENRGTISSSQLPLIVPWSVSIGGFYPPMWKKMLIKLDHFSGMSIEHIWNHHLAYNMKDRS